MQEKDITNKMAPNGARTKLADVIPLNTPLIVQIFDTAICNLSCKFCYQSLWKEQGGALQETRVYGFSIV